MHAAIVTDLCAYIAVHSIYETIYSVENCWLGVRRRQRRHLGCCWCVVPVVSSTQMHANARAKLYAMCSAFRRAQTPPWIRMMTTRRRQRRRRSRGETRRRGVTNPMPSGVGVLASAFARTSKCTVLCVEWCSSLFNCVCARRRLAVCV